MSVMSSLCGRSVESPTQFDTRCSVIVH